MPQPKAVVRQARIALRMLVTGATRELRDAMQPQERSIALEAPLRLNTQITSIGMGKLFVHLFSSANLKLVNDFEIAARSKGLEQLWPHRPRFWPLPERRTQLPAKLTLADEDADVIAHAFAERIKILLNPARPPEHFWI